MLVGLGNKLSKGWMHIHVNVQIEVTNTPRFWYVVANDWYTRAECVFLLPQLEHSFLLTPPSFTCGVGTNPPNSFL